MSGAPNSHAQAVYASWARLRHLKESKQPIEISGSNLTIADVVAVSLHGAKAHLSDDTQQVDRSIALLEERIQAGDVIYGVNTGFGGSADTRTDAGSEPLMRLQGALVQHLNVGILTHADKDRDGSNSWAGKPYDNELLRSHALPSPVVRATMLIRCNSLMRGHSGVRPLIMENILKLLNRDMVPIVPLRGSISASGDLSTLSYIAGALEGNPDIYLKARKPHNRTEILPADKALSLAGLEPVRFQVKEGLGITNGTAPSCATASIAIQEANQLAVLVQLLTAMGTEALAGTAANYHPFISSVRPHPGQAEAASNILAFLAGSKIAAPCEAHPESEDEPAKVRGLAQDRYALRTAPQWIGPQLEDLELATKQVQTELNSTTDNPLIDPTSGLIHHGGNFQAMALTSAMEKTLLALQNLGRLLYAQSSELLNNMTNKGLPPNLSADEPSQSYTCKGFDVNMAAYMAELAYLAKPISPHVQVAEMNNQSVNSMALVAARYALEAVEVVNLMAATYIYVLCQALDLRVLQLEFREALSVRLRDLVLSHVARQRSLKSKEEEHKGLSEVDITESQRRAGKLAECILDQWDKLASLDVAERASVATKQSALDALELLHCGTEYGRRTWGFSDLQAYHLKTARVVADCYGDHRNALLEGKQDTRRWLSGGSTVVYDFVRKELKTPLNRGVVDHPPLLKEQLTRLKEAIRSEAGTRAKEIEEGNDLRSRNRILGSMASEIYEAIRSGELYSRIMAFGRDSKMWGEAASSS
ncbi:phenylalanine ammonia-lyase [Neurospora crassa OR74A]|uniref:Phenylalanine ammonia-lyase n=1 Tax=Neurospora crassa (strain ATCC 24698 / 74-OR23-1A / CBS 708.71 / DSM 1257 / FGSC 987) TaxID=367110 RepID=Q7S2A1_NEUCR|nr:phenylalanine ammonia-lyase [Neurospora crassa OR74A]EAA29498.1 phenylalanine ammonia-lyase [Neurospora crassa OR74A]|eukprot:XP_958734.1 phenylalanine ammonia-lyase [Neurospora crassa OR74A]